MVLVGIVLSFDWCVIANADEKLTIDRTLVNGAFSDGRSLSFIGSL